MNRAVQEGAPNCQTMSFQLVVYFIARRIIGGGHARRRTNEWRNLTPHAWRRMADAGSERARETPRTAAINARPPGALNAGGGRDYGRESSRSRSVASLQPRRIRALISLALCEPLQSQGGCMPALWRQAVLPLVRKFKGTSSHPATRTIVHPAQRATNVESRIAVDRESIFSS